MVEVKSKIKSSGKPICKYFLISFLIITVTGCCELGFTCYELAIGGEPLLKNADIYLDNKLVMSSVSGVAILRVPYKKQELKIVQKGFKTSITILEHKGGRGEETVWINFEPLDSVPSTPSSPSDTTGTVK